MKIQQFGNVVQLTRFWSFNSFLVLEDDSITLVDANLPFSAGAILEAAAAFNRPVRRIVFTHVDYDHIASLDALKKRLPDLEVIVPEREAPLMAGDKRHRPHEPEAKIKLSPILQKTPPTRLIHEGDRVGSLRVVASPGHSPGHVAFVDTRDNTLIAGDAFTSVSRLTVAGTVTLIFPWPAWATWHKPMALESAKKLRALNPSRLAVGHGPTLENPLAAMDKAIAEAEGRLGGKARVVSSAS